MSDDAGNKSGQRRTWDAPYLLNLGCVNHGVQSVWVQLLSKLELLSLQKLKEK